MLKIEWAEGYGRGAESENNTFFFFQIQQKCNSMKHNNVWKGSKTNSCWTTILSFAWTWHFNSCLFEKKPFWDFASKTREPVSLASMSLSLRRFWMEV